MHGFVLLSVLNLTSLFAFFKAGRSEKDNCFFTNKLVPLDILFFLNAYMAEPRASNISEDSGIMRFLIVLLNSGSVV